MYFKSPKAIVFTICVLLLILILPTNSSTPSSTTYSPARNFNGSYSFYVHYGDFRFEHKVFVSVSPSLYDYYHGENHSLGVNFNYSRFVTPDAVRPIAESILNVTRNMPHEEEEFANSVLMLVHDIPYKECPVKYPVETIMDNLGDCDATALLAASILKAGGLDVVLLYYTDMSPRHMNLGIYLPYEPSYNTLLGAPKGLVYNNKTYYYAESTPRQDWMVGEQPDSLAGTNPWVIPLDDCERSSPAQVASSLDAPLIPSSTSINISSGDSKATEKWGAIRISGSISPAYSGKSVVTYVSKNGSSWSVFKAVLTDDLGCYSLTWNLTSSGRYNIRASLGGFSNYTSSDSETLTIFMKLVEPLDDFVLPETTVYDNLESRKWHVIDAYKYFISQIDLEEFIRINMSGKGVSLSGDFIIFGSKQPASARQQTITLPPYTEEIKVYYQVRSRLYVTTIKTALPEQNITVPMPSSQLGVVLCNNGENNYSVRVTELNSSGISQIAEPVGVDGTEDNLLNASMVTRENTWYKVVAKMSDDGATAQLYDENSSLLKNITSKEGLVSMSELGILIADDYAGDVIAFKNLKIESLEPLTTSSGNPQNRLLGLDSIGPYIGLTVVSAVAVTVIVYARKRKRAGSKIKV